MPVCLARVKCVTTALLLALTCAPSLVGQRGRAGPIQPFPGPPPDVADESQQQSPTIKTETIVVPVRVVVRDAQGHAIGNLQEDDFRLFQDGKQQDIANFTPVSLAPPAPTAIGANAPASSSPSAVQPVIGTPQPAQRFVALFFDDVHITIEDLQRARNAADRYVQTSLQPDDRVAIFTVSGQSQQDFTSDRAVLHKALLALLPHAVTAGDPDSAGDCPPMDFYEADAIANQGMAQVLAIATQDALQCAFNGQPGFRAQAQDLASRTAEHLVFADDEETEASFRRIREVVRRISALAGQRDVVLISPGFLYTGHDTELAEIIDNAIHSDVVVNTLDARGLYTSDLSGDISQPAVGRPPGAQALLDSFRMADQHLANNVLVELADSTGGLAFVNNNDFDAGLRNLAAAPEAYYLLAYSPRNLKADGRYHHLKVTLTAKDNYTIEARHGFYAPARGETVAQAARREIDDALFSQSVQHDLPVDLQTRIEKKADGGRKLDIFADLDIAQLHFRKANGVNQEGLTLVAALFDRNGNYVDGTQKVLNFNLKDATLAQFSKTGASSELDLDVKPGVYFLRFVARDTNDNHMSAENATVDVPE
ncbi:MAG TPA: VWA domain-containing protein [Candidatus Acidoferrales bacterium]|nr:VWA domain-containing protein [Candidatus Acidoferrales bacterium]